MMPAADVLKSLNDARQTLTSVFEALERWSDEVSSVNERHLAKDLDQVATSQRGMGWPGPIHHRSPRAPYNGVKDADVHDRPGHGRLGASAQVFHRSLDSTR